MALLCCACWSDEVASFLFERSAWQNYFSELLGVFFLGVFLQWWLRRRDAERIRPTREYAHSALFECLADFQRRTLPHKYSGEWVSIHFGRCRVYCSFFKTDIEGFELSKALENDWKMYCFLVQNSQGNERMKWESDLRERLKRIGQLRSDLDELIHRWPVLNEIKEINSIARIHEHLDTLAQTASVEKMLQDFTQGGGLELCHTISEILGEVRKMQHELLGHASNGRELQKARKFAKWTL